MPNVLEALFHVANIPGGFTIAKKHIAPFLVDILWNTGIMTDVRRGSPIVRQLGFSGKHILGHDSNLRFDKGMPGLSMKPRAVGTR